MDPRLRADTTLVVRGTAELSLRVEADVLAALGGQLVVRGTAELSLRGA